MIEEPKPTERDRSFPGTDRDSEHTRPSLASIRGAWHGRVHIAEDFDRLPSDIAEPFGAD